MTNILVRSELRY